MDDFNDLFFGDFLDGDLLSSFFCKYDFTEGAFSKFFANEISKYAVWLIHKML